MKSVTQKKTSGIGSKAIKPENVPDLETMILEQIEGAERALSIDAATSRKADMQQAIAGALRCLQATRAFALLVNHEAQGR